METNSQINHEKESQQQLLPIASCDGQVTQDNQQSSKLVSWNSHTVKEILDELLKQDKPSLSDSARYQEVQNIYLLISPGLMAHAELVGMSRDYARSLVLLELRKNGNSLGVETESDKWSL